MNFEAEMSKVASISGATGDEFQKLIDKAKEMGSKTKFSATESAQAMEYMAMAGWKTQDMVDGLKGIMDLAAASGEDLASTSDIVTDALTAFGLSASDSTHFADVLAKSFIKCQYKRGNDGRNVQVRCTGSRGAGIFRRRLFGCHWSDGKFRNQGRSGGYFIKTDA